MRRPRFIAAQARNARGLAGWIVAAIMARETRLQNVEAIDLLDVAPGARVLDLGCGPGHSLSVLAKLVEDGDVTGVDSSDLMVKIATHNNRALIKAGDVSVVKAAAAHLPFEDSAFDKVLCVHVVYFWDDLRENLKEIARVLEPGGQLALVFRSTADKSAASSFPSDIYRFRSVLEICAALTEEGFKVRFAQAPPTADVPRLAPHLILATLP